MNRKQKDLTKVFILLLILSFIIVNWSDVSWMFNYREISGLMYGFLNPYPDAADAIVGGNINRQTAIQTISDAQNPSVPSKVYPYSEKDDSLQIALLNLETPVVIGASTNIASLEKDLDKGAVLYPGSVYPGQPGQMVLLGHSAPPGWPKIKHDWVFSEIEKLNPKDQIILHFGHKRYTYKVVEKKILKRGQEVPTTSLTGRNNILTLVSCWP